MVASQLSFYNGTPFIASNEILLTDTYTATANQQTFLVTEKPISDLATTIQAGNTQFYYYNSGFTVAPCSFTLATPLLVGTQVVAPGSQMFTMSAFDALEVVGVVNPRVSESPAWLIDPETINNFKYNALPSYPGLQISMAQLITGSLAQSTWISFASADASGNAMTYGVTGAPLYLPAINAFTTLASTSSAGETTLTIASTAGFMPGMYISIDLGLSTSEILHVIAINPNQLVLDPTGTTFDHSPGALIYACGWKFWAKVQIPLNATNNTPVNLYNLGLQRLGAIAARP